MQNYPNLRFVLVNTTHPGNIGAAARAIKNMGFRHLYLVSPRCFPHAEAIARSSGAEDILESAVVVSTLTEAVFNCQLILGTSARSRALPIPLVTAKEGVCRSLPLLNQGGEVAILFGQERIGLTNDELSLCNLHVHIPCNSNFASLNIASAVQILAYEFHLGLCFDHREKDESHPSIAPSYQLERFYDHLNETLIQLEFLNPKNPRQMMKKLRRMFGRAQLEEGEVNILRGILTAINRKMIEK